MTDSYSTEPGGYLLSDQGSVPETRVLERLTEIRDILQGLTFRSSPGHERTRDTALIQVEALWRTIYYANGS